MSSLELAAHVTTDDNADGTAMDQSSPAGDGDSSGVSKKVTELPCLPLIAWSDLENISHLKHGTGTWVYAATLRGEDVIIKTPREGLRSDAIHGVVRACAREVVRWREIVVREM